MPELKDAFANYLLRKKDVVVNPENILPVDSAAFGIYLTCKTLLNAGDEAIVFDPVDYLFRYSVETVGGKAISFSIPPGTDKVDFSAMETLITPKTKLICLCNPLNPTGKVFTQSELFQLAFIAEKHNLMILSDEIWSDIVFAPNEFTSIASLDENINKRTIIVTGLSKSYGLAGLRIGAVICSDNSIFKKLQQQSLHQSTIHGVNIISQVAATTALNECDEWLDQFVAHLHKMRTICTNELNAINGITCIPPQGCYVAFADIRKTGMSSEEMHQLLLKEAKVAVVPGLKEWFGKGAEGYIRLSFATSEEILKEAFTRIRHIM
jgi:aminotransferase/cystathionine beta-lyase